MSPMLLVIALAAAAPSDGMIEGRIRDIATGRPVAHAQVSLPALERATRSDRDGYYRFDRVPSGDWALRAEHREYGAREVRVRVPDAGTVRIDVALARADDIRGRVLGRRFGMSVSGATVVRIGDGEATGTDEDGGFRLPPPDTTPIRLRVERVGYVPLDTVVAPPYDGIVLRLEERPVRLRPLTAAVSGDTAAAGGGLQRELFEREVVPGVVGVTQTALREVPPAAEIDVMRTLQAVRGVVALNDLAAQLHVKGGGPDQNLFLLDEARVFGPYHVFGAFGAFNSDAVDRVEFYRGSIPARYGGALSSVVDVTPASGSPEPEATAALSTLAARFRVSDGRGPHAWLLAGRRSHVDLLTDHGLFGFYDVQGRYDARLSDRQTLHASFLVSDDGFDGLPYFSVGENLSSAWRNRVFSATWERIVGRGSLVSASAWSSGYDGELVVNDEVVELPTMNDVGVHGLRLEFAAPGRSLGLRAGTELARGSVRLAGEGEGAYLDDTIETKFFRAAAYAEGEAVVGRFRFAPGIRVVAETGGGRVLVEPRVGVRARLANALHLTLGVGRTHQLFAALRDDRVLLPGAPMWFYRPDGAPASRADAVDLALDAEPAAGWRLGAAAYLRRLDDVPRWRPEGARTAAEIGYDDGEAAGAELFIRKQTGRVTGWLGYSLASVSLTEMGTGRTYRPQWDRRHSVDLAAFISLGESMRVSGRVTYGTGSPFWPPINAFAPAELDPIGSRLEGAAQYGGLIGQQVREEVVVFGDQQARFPDYVRVDVALRYRGRIRGAQVEPFLSLINATNHYNVLFYRLSSDFRDPKPLPSEPPDNGWYGLEPLLAPVKQLPILPTIGVEIRF